MPVLIIGFGTIGFTMKVFNNNLTNYSEPAYENMKK